MAAITTGVVAAGAAAYSANRQSEAAKDAARAQSQGVEAARQDTMNATDRARIALGYSVSQPPLAQAAPTTTTAPQTQISSSNSGRTTPLFGVRANRNRTAETPVVTQTQVTQPEVTQTQVSQPQTSQPQTTPAQMGPMPTQQQVDPRGELLTGIGTSAQFANQGFGQAENTLSPLAQLAQPFVDEQYDLLGLGGADAYNTALGRVADPLAAEQERAILRNNAALGGVGGNVLSQLAEQTRARTEANIGNRLAQLSSASSPALSALQNQANIQQNRGLSLSGIFGQGGAALADQETNRRNALANIEIGQGAQMSQLSQNLGNANAGASAYAAQNSPALSQGIMSGLSAYMGAGGTFGNQYPTQAQVNRQSGYSFDDDPFS